jgi:acetoin utilization deacetylase AcuC-like enzyme
VSGEAAFVHDPSLEDYVFGEGHPFQPVRIRMTIELPEALGLLKGYSLIESEPATDEEIGRVHYTSYINGVRETGRDQGYLDEEPQVYGLGAQANPVLMALRWIFYDDPDVLMVSVHESGRRLFPGTGTVKDWGGETAVRISAHNWPDDWDFTNVVRLAPTVRVERVPRRLEVTTSEFL